MVDKRLCFGAHNSPGIFHRLTQAVRRMMQRRGYNVVCLLDGILVIDQDYNKCHSGYVTLIDFLHKLGLAIVWKKICDSSQEVIYLGVYVDSRSMTISLPEDKRVKFAALLQDFEQCTRASKRQLQRLAGKLAYAAHVVADGGRTY